MKKVLIVSLLSTLFAAPAFAAAPGGYVALDVQNWSASNTGALGNPGVGLRIGGGYRFTQNWGLEANYAESSKSSSVGGADYKFTAFQIAATGTLPINPQFDVYAKLGASANKFDRSPSVPNDTKTSFMWGIGGQYNIDEQWGVRLEYADIGDATDFPVGSQVSGSTVSLGGVYSF